MPKRAVVSSLSTWQSGSFFARFRFLVRFCSFQIPDLVSAADEVEVGETEKLVKLKKGLEFLIHLHDRVAEFYTGFF